MELAAHVRHYQITAVGEVILVSKDVPLKLADDQLQGVSEVSGVTEESYLRVP